MIRCVAIDDEPLALRQIEGYIDKTPFLHPVAGCRSAFEAMVVLAKEQVDLLFVDINMPDLNGLEFVRSLPSKPLIIFTTAYSEYALEGFRVDALDYLLKPIGYPDFLSSAEKAWRQFRLLGKEKEMQTLFVKSEYRMVQIEIDRITHLESQSEYVRIFTETNRPVMTLGSLRSYEEKLPPKHFMRIHRSYIVNLKKIIAIERKSILLPPDIRIPVGDSYEEVLKNYLEKHSWFYKVEALFLELCNLI